MLRLYTEMSLGACRDPQGAAELLNMTNKKAERLENEAGVFVGLFFIYGSSKIIERLFSKIYFNGFYLQPTKRISC